MTFGFDIDVRLKRQNQDFDFRFQTSGGLTVIFGPSGAGKTTILNLITGLTTPDEGHIAVGERTLFSKNDALNTSLSTRAIGYVPQDLLLFPHMTVAQNLKYGQKQENTALYQHYVDMLDLGSLLEQRPPQLSGGEGRRLALGRALLSNPAALLLDEPMAGLDPARRQRLLPFIERIRQDVKIPILYVSHFAEEAVRLADDAVMVQNGKTIAYGAAENVFSNPDAEAHFGPFDLGSILEGKVARLEDGLVHIDCQGQTFKVTGHGYKIGASIRLRILARDIALSLDKPGRTTVQNAIPCVISDMSARGQSLFIRLNSQQSAHIQLSAMITPQSAKQLALHPGQDVYAMIKAVAVARSRHPTG